jgi:hypothetical protein
MHHAWFQPDEQHGDPVMSRTEIEHWLRSRRLDFDETVLAFFAGTGGLSGWHNGDEVFQVWGMHRFDESAQHWSPLAAGLIYIGDVLVMSQCLCIGKVGHGFGMYLDWSDPIGIVKVADSIEEGCDLLHRDSTSILHGIHRR